MVYGYCRVSTGSQKVERQKCNILSVFPNAQIIEEKGTGTNIKNRKKFNQLLKDVELGDTIAFDSIDRMSRSVNYGIKIYVYLLNKGVNLSFIKEPCLNSDEYNKHPYDTFKSLLEFLNVSEIEVRNISKRTSEGIREAKRNGKQIGLVKGTKLTTKKSIEVKDIIRERNKSFGGDLNNKQTIELCGITEKTFYKYKKEILNELYEEVC